MNRRQLIAAAPAAFLSGPAPASGMSPMEVKYREVIQIRDIVESGIRLHGMQDEEADALMIRAFEIADEMIDMPSREPMDLIYKIMGYTMDGAHEITAGEQGERIWSEARALVAA